MTSGSSSNEQQAEMLSGGQKRNKGEPVAGSRALAMEIQVRTLGEVPGAVLRQY